MTGRHKDIRTYTTPTGKRRYETEVFESGKRALVTAGSVADLREKAFQRRVAMRNAAPRADADGAPHNPTVGQAVARLCERRNLAFEVKMMERPGRAKMLKSHLRTEIRRLAETSLFFGEDAPLRQLGQASAVERYRRYLLQKPNGHDLDKPEGQRRRIEPKTANHYLIALKAVISQGVRWGAIETAPQIERFVVRSVGKCSLTRENFPAFWGALAGPPKPFRAMVAVFLATGARAGNVLDLKTEWLQADRGLLFVADTKGKKPRYFAIPDWALEEIRAYRATLPAAAAATEWLFPNPKTRMPYEDINYHLARASAKVGIRPAVTHHMFRRFLTEVVCGITDSSRDTQEFIGWSDAMFVEIYTAHAKAGRRRKIADQLGAALFTDAPTRPKSDEAKSFTETEMRAALALQRARPELSGDEIVAAIARPAKPNGIQTGQGLKAMAMTT